MKWLIALALSLSGLEALSLQEAEQIALSNNPEIKTAEEMLEMARQGRLNALSKWFPQIGIASQGFKIESPIPLLKLNKPSAFMTNLSLTQAVFSPELYHRVKLSTLTIDQFDKMLRGAKNDILLQIRTLYFRVALDHHKQKTAKEHIDLLNYLAERMEGKYNIGEATAYNVNQARVAVSNATEAYYQTSQMLQSHQDELAKALGYDPLDVPFAFAQEDIDVKKIPELAQKIDVVEALFQKENILKTVFVDTQNKMMKTLFTKDEFQKWDATADASRPDVQLSKTFVRIADETVRLKQGEYWPTISIVGNYGGASTPYFFQPSTQFNNQIFKWGIGLSLNWTIFDGFGRNRRVQQAKAEARAMKFNATRVVQAVHTQVHETLYAMEKSLAQYVTASANYKLANQTLDQAKSQLDIGYITIYDYMISVDSLIRAKTTYDESCYQLISSYYSLLHATGKETP
jgi:outer membrane protein TolC